MKKFKNKKGVTGVDVVLSITIILISFGIIIGIYSTYTKRNKEINRKTKATNIALAGAQFIDNHSLDNIKEILSNNNNVPNTEEKKDESGNTIGHIYELSDAGRTAIQLDNNIPKGYTVKIEIMDQHYEDAPSQISASVSIIVEYKVDNSTQNVTIPINKKKENFEQAVEPSITFEKGKYTIEGVQNNVVPIRYDSYLDQYVETTHKNSEWYSISSGRYAVVAEYSYADSKEIFSSNGIVNDSKVDNYYVWMPKICQKNVGSPYYFCTEDGYLIEYVNEENSSFYKKSNESGQSPIGGYWVKIKNKDLNSREPDDNDANKDNYKILIQNIIKNL